MIKFKIDSTLLGLAVASLVLASVSCDPVAVDVPEDYIPAVQSGVEGFYLLNEGTMGHNNASLDYVDLQAGKYISDIFSLQNPEMAMELGDTGNDLLIADGYLVIALNGSGLLEIADASTAKHIAQVSVPSCRYVIEEGGYLYVTSYADGGSLYKISLDDFSVAGRLDTGRDPEQLHFHNGFIYVLNSGGMSAETAGYEQSVSVVDVASFEVVETVDTGYKNLYKVICGGDVEYMTSRGDYGADPGAVFSYDRANGEVTLIENIPVSNWCSFGGMIYTQTTTYDKEWNPQASFGKIEGGKYTEADFLDLSQVNLVSCYGLDVNPSNGDFVLTDAGYYPAPGTVHYFRSDGTLLWSHTAGVFPSRIAWVYGAE